MYICNCGREFKTRRSLNSHARFCNLYIKKKVVSKYLIDGKYICECKKSFDKFQSMNAHFSHCELHQGKKITGRTKGKSTWLKGLTKETDERVAKIGKKISDGISDGSISHPFKGKKHSVETKKIMSEKRIENYKDNTFHCKFYIVNNGEKDIKVQGTYERDFAIFLNSKNIKWDRIKLLYDEYHYYTPDFYIVDLDIYIEIKGWLMERDKKKYNKFFCERNDIIYCCFKKDMDKIINGDLQFNELPLLKNLI